ncbi:MAG TPA: hypothetical protein VGK59_04300 [Ohtaekwangia sp.]
MSRRKTHTAKSQSEKQYYSDFIRNRDYSPTVDDSLKFEETTDENSEFKVGSNVRRRGRPLGEQFGDHMHEFWFQYLSGGVALVFIFLMIDSKVDFARLFEKTDHIEQQIQDVKEEIKDVEQLQKRESEKIYDELKEHELKLRETQINIDNLEKRRR